MEEQPVNTILATLHATDADSTISEYQLIDSNGDNGNEYFEINNVTGKQKHSTIYFIYLLCFLSSSLSHSLVYSPLLDFIFILLDRYLLFLAQHK